MAVMSALLRGGGERERGGEERKEVRKKESKTEGKIEKAKKEIYTYVRKKGRKKEKRQKYNLTIGDELPAGIIQLAKVYIAKKRKITVGDKMEDLYI